MIRRQLFRFFSLALSSSFSRAQRLVFALVALMMVQGCDLLELLRARPTPPPDEVLNRAAEPGQFSVMTAGEKLAFFRWLVVEMREQVFGKKNKDSTAVLGWANVLAQRGSIEGVYHGFVFSSEYALLERNGTASVKALRFFGQEMALLDFPSLPDSDVQVQAAAAKYAKDFLKANVYVLKRVLGERVLKESTLRRADQEKLAAWYSGIAKRLSLSGVSFGLKQRENKDEVFHFQWAKENSLGLIQWELLNRFHRILNELGGLAVSPPGK